MMSLKKAAAIFSLFLSFSPAAPAEEAASAPFAASKSQEARAFDHSLWDSFLKKYVNEAGEIDYSAAKKDPSLLKDYLAKVSALDEFHQIREWVREEQLAFWLNVYHAAQTRLILDHYPIKTILDIPGIWDISAIKVGAIDYSLNKIRYEKLMGVYHDEKIDTVIACSAKSCPGLPRDAYYGPRVEGQLFQLARKFVNDPVRNDIVPGKKKIQISKIFKWYAKDFTLDFGLYGKESRLKPADYAVVSFIANYTDSAETKDYLDQGNYKIKYLPFDWTLADAGAPQSSSRA